eukprot:9878566-Lingulodinium_polyedra.AAC.1
MPAANNVCATNNKQTTTQQLNGTQEANRKINGARGTNRRTAAGPACAPNPVGQKRNAMPTPAPSIPLAGT